MAGLAAMAIGKQHSVINLDIPVLSSAAIRDISGLIKSSSIVRAFFELVVKGKTDLEVNVVEDDGSVKGAAELRDFSFSNIAA